MDTNTKEIIPVSKIRNPNNCVRTICPEGALKPVEFLSQLPERSVDLILTAPPGVVEVDKAEEFVDTWIRRALACLKLSGRAYIIVDTEPHALEVYSKALNSQNTFFVGSTLTWADKPPASIRARRLDYLPNCITIFYLYGPEALPLSCPTRAERLSHQKARTFAALAARLISHSTKKDDLIVGPFADDDGFLRIATMLGRRAVGFEYKAECKQTRECGCVHVDAQR